MHFFFFMKNMFGKILGFGRMQQYIYIYIFFFENALIFFFEKFRRQPGILIPDLYFTV